MHVILARRDAEGQSVVDLDVFMLRLILSAQVRIGPAAHAAVATPGLRAQPARIQPQRPLLR